MRKDGRRIEVSLTVSPMLDEDGRVIAASTITRDVSEQKAAERKLAESARHFELINDLVATCGFDGYFKQLNGAWEPTLGWTREELLPNPFIEIVHPDDREAVDDEVAKLARGGTTAEFKIRVATKDGGWRWTEWSASPGPADGRLFHCVGREITERMRGRAGAGGRAPPARRRPADRQRRQLGARPRDAASRHLVGAAVPQPRLRPGTGRCPTFEQVLERIHPDDQVDRAAPDGGDRGGRPRVRVLLPGRAPRRTGARDRRRGPAVRRRRGLDAG